MKDTNRPDRENARVDPGAYEAWLFDLDGVLTKTASVHAAAWKQAFDGFLVEEGALRGEDFTPFDPGADYQSYVDGEPRADGVRNFLASRGITIPEGTDGDAADARTVQGLGNRKNELLLHAFETHNIPPYDGAVALVKVLNSQGTRTAVVSASENTAAALEAAGIADLFDARVDGHVVKDRHLAGKPAPDSYLEAARLLGVDPARSVVVEDALAGVEAGRAGRFGLVVGVNHHDGAGGHDYADQLRAHGADVVVTDLAELLEQPEPSRSVDYQEHMPNKPDGGGRGETEFIATIASSLIFVAELERSVSFYREVFACTVSVRHGNGALLLAPGGFQIYLVAIGDRQEHRTGGIGEHHLLWTTHSATALDHFEQLFKDRGCYTYTHVSGGVTFVEGSDPDGIRVVVSYPSPQQHPRSVLDGRLYN